MKKVKFYDDKVVEYVAKVSKNAKKVILKHSKANFWLPNVKGTKIGKLKDNGDDIKIKINDKTLDLRYDEFIELYYMMKLKYDNDKKL